MKNKLISILSYLGFDMSAWEDSDEPQELSEEQVEKIEAMKNEHEQFKADNAQLTADLKAEKTAKEKAEGETKTANTAKKTAEDALEAAQTTTSDALTELSIEAEEGTTPSEAINKILSVAKGKPGAEHTKTKSEGDELNEEQKEADKFEHNRTADEALGD